MSRAEKKLRARLKESTDFAGQQLALALYARCADLQLITLCQEWAEVLRAVADAIEKDYGEGANTE